MKNTLGKRLKEFANEYFGSVKNLAFKLKMDPSHISQFITGRSLPSATVLKKLSEVGCDLHWLLTGEKNQKSPLKEPSAFTEIDYLRNEIVNLNEIIDLLKDKIKNLENEKKETKLRLVEIEEKEETKAKIF